MTPSKGLDALDALTPPEPTTETPAPAPTQEEVDAARRAHRPLPDGAAKRKRGRPRKNETASAPVETRKPRAAPVSAPGAGPSVDEEAASEARKNTRRAFFAANEAQVKKALGTLYGVPFDVAAHLGKLNALALTKDEKGERAETMYWVLMVYCPDWTRHLPLIVLGAAFAGDASAKWALWKEANAKTKAPGPVPPKASAVPVELIPPEKAPTQTKPDGNVTVLEVKPETV